MRPPPHQRGKPSPQKPKYSGRTYASRGGRRSAGPPWLLLAGLAVVLLMMAAGGIWFTLNQTTPGATRALATEDTPAEDTPGGSADATDSTDPAGSNAPADATAVAAPATVTPTPVPPTNVPPPTATAGPAPFDAAAVQADLLAMINADRTAAGLQPVEWDETAAGAGQAHAQEMADVGYLSHWNLDGYGPDYRYTAAGGLHIARENIFSLSAEGGKAAPISDWKAVAQQAEQSLMASEGHRANILAPAHTHVGIGVAYQPATGELRIAQEFVDQYADIQSPPLRAASGDRFMLRGTLHPGVSNPIANLAYEPFPEPPTLDELAGRTTYRSPAVFLDEPGVSLEGSDFVFDVAIPENALPGLYHIRMWADTEAAEDTQIINIVVTVD